ncbi:hypothetical protein PCA31118_01334 [Pandoraea captiosa]|uniref:Surface presentation of antigen domain-containing protein n=1 Tax=Pandoraea captiosa TaxID=2508302 RepID=A0A5E4ZRZ0_9BURK|nr:hypothetical protein [Pandoraea captiosa]VVE63628.1 hypothetical protein PCA31118_01334 [Pandoraea captiosa]
MGPMSGAVTVVPSVGPAEPGLQQTDEKSMRDRVDEARRQHESADREREVPLDAALVWLMHVPQDRSPPLSFDERRGARRTDSDSDASSGKRATEEVERAERRLRDEAGAAAERPAAKANASMSPPVRAGEIDTARTPTGTEDGRSGTADQTTTAQGGERAVNHAKEGKMLLSAPSNPSASDDARIAQATPGSDTSGSGRHGNADAGGSGTPVLALLNGQAPTLHRPALSAPVRMPRGAQSQAHLPRQTDGGGSGGSGARASGAGESLRYAFGSWGRGHFVNVQVVQTDGRRSFVLGASDAIVQRRLSAALPHAASGVSSSHGPNGIDLHTVKAIESTGDSADEAS